MIDAVDDETGEEKVSPHSPYNTRSSRRQEELKMVLVCGVIRLSRKTTLLSYVILLFGFFLNVVLTSWQQ